MSMRIAASLASSMALAFACAACSRQPAPAQPLPPLPAEVAPAGTLATVGAMPVQAAASGGTTGPRTSSPREGPSLADMLQRPVFAKALASAEGAAGLPAWVGTGGVSTPSHEIRMDGRPMWLSHGCKSEDCGDGEIWLLVDPRTHAIQGVFLDEHGGASAQAGEPVWLGKPDAATRAFLEQRISED